MWKSLVRSDMVALSENPYFRRIGNHDTRNKGGEFHPGSAPFIYGTTAAKAGTVWVIGRFKQG
jgi:hypothetical protein